MEQLINICSAGSSGSTLLADLLDRHPKIACGDEIGLLSKPIVYYDFDLLVRSSRLIRRVGVSSAPFFCERSILRSLPAYTLSDDRVWTRIKSAKTLRELLDDLYDSIVRITDKPIWAEKTPENAYYLREFAESFPRSKLIHIVRDPRDVILSLMKRGLSIHHAAMNWLTSVSAVQRMKSNKNFLELKYEDLAHHPEKELESICRHIGIGFDMTCFVDMKSRSKGLKMSKGHKSWTLRPSHPISTKAVGRYKDARLDCCEVLSMRLTERAAQLLGTKQLSIHDLIGIYGYEEPNRASAPSAYRRRRSSGKLAAGNWKQLFLHHFFKKRLREAPFVDLVEY